VSLQRLVDIQCELAAELGLHCRVLNMPTEELGASAYQKVRAGGCRTPRGVAHACCLIDGT
jgi:hypothetical protein